LNELCVLKRITPTRLIDEAINSQGARWEEFIEEVTIPSKPGEPEIWPEDPLYILARVLMVHLIRVFHKRLEDPSGFEELRKNAPAEWSFAIEQTRRKGRGRLVEISGVIGLGMAECFAKAKARPRTC
jgi:hypothetical protein